MTRKEDQALSAHLRRQKKKWLRTKQKEPVPATGIKTAANDLPNEVLLGITSYCDPTAKGGGTLQMLSLANKKFYDLATIELYANITVTIPKTKSAGMKYPGIERLARTLVRNPELGQRITSLSIKFDWRDPTVFGDHVPGDYITEHQQDVWVLKKLTGRISHFPIFSDFPTGKRFWDTQRVTGTDHQPEVSAHAIAQHWTNNIQAERPDALIAFVLGLTPNLDGIEFEHWDRFWAIDGRPEANHYQVSNEDANYVFRILRGALNTQNIVAGLQEEKRGSYNQGVLYRLRSVKFKAECHAPSDCRVDWILPFVALPSVKRADLSFLDIDAYGGVKARFKLPEGFNIKLGIEHLVLYPSHADKNLVRFLECCPDLKTVFYKQPMHDYGRHVGNINKMLSRAKNMSGSKIRVLVITTAVESGRGFRANTWRGFPQLVKLQLHIRNILGYPAWDGDFFKNPGYYHEDRHPERERLIRSLDDSPVDLTTPLHEQLSKHLKTLDILWFRFHPRYKQIYVLLEQVIRLGGQNGVPQLRNIVLGHTLWSTACDRLVRAPELRSMLRAAEEKGIKVWKYTSWWMLPKEEVSEDLVPYELHGGVEEGTTVLERVGGSSA